MDSIVTALDYILLIPVLSLIYYIYYSVGNSWYPVGHPWRRYFISGLTVKIAAAIFISLLYVYFYGYGDTIAFYKTSRILNSVLTNEGFFSWIKIIFRIPSWHEAHYYDYISQMESSYFIASNHIPSAVAAVLGVLCFNTFLPVAVLFAAFAYTGIWALFRAMSKLLPHQTKLVALAILYLPSVAIWSSGVFKDTICMFSLGWIFYGSFQIFLYKNYNIKNILFTAFNIYVLSIVKVYIVAAFIPSLLFWLLQVRTAKIQNLARKVTFQAFVLIGVTVATFWGLSSFEDQLGDYSLENVSDYSNFLRNELLEETLETQGSSYDLGQVEPGLVGMLKKFPQAVNVTLFRPYLWEVNKPIVLLSALESLAFAALVILLLFRVGLRRIMSIIRANPTAQFCLLFTLIFAFSTGISTYNFGTLSRYKIPCMPFFAVLLVIVYTMASQGATRPALWPAPPQPSES